MIDGVGRPGAPRPTMAETSPKGPTRIEAATPVAGAAAVQGPAASNLGRIAKDLAASPPVDGAKVAMLRNAIASGEYKPDPDKIAARMIALETVPVKD